METDNPILDKGFAVGGQTRHLTLVDTPTPSHKKRPPAAIMKLISELGLRYRPTSQTDLQAHGASLALLADDLADMPVELLRKAIAKHVMESPYLPKAADLVKLAKSFIPERPSMGSLGETMAQRGNRLMSHEHARVMHWVDDGSGGAFLDHVA